MALNRSVIVKFKNINKKVKCKYFKKNNFL